MIPDPGPDDGLRLTVGEVLCARRGVVHRLSGGTVDLLGCHQDNRGHTDHPAGVCCQPHRGGRLVVRELQDGVKVVTAPTCAPGPFPRQLRLLLWAYRWGDACGINLR
jgi:hypothetical protein